MKGLLIKDFKLLMEQKRFLLIVPVFGVFFMISNGELSSGLGYITMLSTLLILSTISYDEYDNGMSFLMTLPFDRAMYVKEKYVFSGLITLISATIALFLAVFAALAAKITFEWVELLAVEGIMVLLSWLILAVTIPLQIKFGAEKGRIAMLLFAGVIAAVSVLLAKGKEYFDIDLLPIINRIMELHKVTLIMIVMLLGLLVISLSYFAGRAIIRKKEF